MKKFFDSTWNKKKSIEEAIMRNIEELITKLNKIYEKMEENNFEKEDIQTIEETINTLYEITELNFYK